MLAYFTQVDYDRDIALVAMDDSPDNERMLGVARIMTGLKGVEHEFSIVVGDPWQGQGIAAELMKRLILIARERGFKSLWGLVLGENTQMLNLARKMGFTSSWNTDQRCYEVRMALEPIPQVQ